MLRRIWQAIFPPRFLTEEEIVDDILANMSAAQEESWRRTTRTEVIQQHHSLGQWIRNQYKLWDPRNPHVILSNPTSPYHPDNMSYRVMMKVWEAVTNGV